MRSTCEHFIPLDTECGRCESAHEIRELRHRLQRATDLLTAYWCACRCRAPGMDPCFTCQNLKHFIDANH